MSNIQTGAERMPHDLSHLGFLAGQIGRLITISTTPVDRKSGSAGMPRPISYAVFCLKKRSELKAADVKFVIDRAMNPETKHPAPAHYATIGDIIVKDDYTITFALKTTTANFLLNMARQGSVIYPREAVDTLKSEPIGTGPYKLG